MWDSFEMLEMDTDSTYFACAYETMDEGVKPEILKNDWEAAKQKYLVMDKSQKELQGFSKRSGWAMVWFVLTLKLTSGGKR